MKLNKKKTVLDEREQIEMYRVEHMGLWMMYGLLCAAILVQLLMGASMMQMAGELAVVIVTSVVMVIANARHGIWDETSRPSNRGNAAYSLMAGVCVAVLLAVTKGSLMTALAAGAGAGVLCFAALTALMRYMQRRQAMQEKALED